MNRSLIIAVLGLLAATQPATADELFMRQASQLLGFVGYRDSGVDDTAVDDTPVDGATARFLSLHGVELKTMYLADSEHPLLIESQGAGRVDAIAQGLFTDDADYNASFSLYRLWLRAFYRQGELRLGLQQLNFGAARLLRPLRWFDTLDPNDPLQLSTGVNALLLRYFTENDSTFWLWGMIANDELKGVEYLPSHRFRPEVGGRAGTSLLGGEAAITFHHRSIEDDTDPTLVFAGHEERLAVDGTWDLGVGLWTEAYVSRVALDQGDPLWHAQGMVGLDYTFGSGVHVLAEHLVAHFQAPSPAEDTTINVTGAIVDYNLNLIDQVSAMAFFAWENSDVSLIAVWLRSYDNWRIQVLGFSLPTEDPGSASIAGRDRVVGLTGRGVELRISYDYDIFTDIGG